MDDAPEQRALAERMMQRLGYHVSVAESGRKALEALRLQTFDLFAPIPPQPA